ncbi:hypothetical protein BD410DRAFT_151248 [Rickenella mellea]|uniref:Uncharacterized protein n=1 Tax=Rickenella mellea TaxID=50990 RepID=A0A4Y7Q8Z2_9AGAM|nr:hypothetical protein BD410DRAFT_151248 [Rickenella mellea]
MSLDQNLFTLNVVPKQSDPNIVDLVDPAGNAHYRKERVAGPTYTIHVYDPLSESLLATATAPSATSKAKTVELHNPSVPVELKFTGTISFRWSFKWEDHDFEWRKEECYMLRKPDPPVLVAITKDPPGKIKPRTVQILDYNLNRFDINDRKGLEIVLLTSLLSFSDASDTYHASSGDSSLPTPIRRKSEPDTPPPPPPKPVKTGLERIAQLQEGEVNEITVYDEGEFNDYAQLCVNLLQNDDMLFVKIMSSSPETVPKVLQVAHEAKRMRHKSGEDEELHQYVLYDTNTPNLPTPGPGPGKKGPRVINLDDGAETKGKGKEMDKYKPPSSISVHLSKIPMPELQPKVNHGSKTNYKQKDAKADKGDKQKAGKSKAEKSKGGVGRRSSFSGAVNSSQRPPSPPKGANAPKPPEVKKLSKPTHSRVQSSHVGSHQTHPNQPSPSPAQLNNPSVYAAPPPALPPHPAGWQNPQQPPYPIPYATRPPGPPYGTHLAPPPPPIITAAPRPITPSIVTDFLDRLKTW